MALNRSDKSRILRRYFPGMTRNSEMSTEPSLFVRFRAADWDEFPSSRTGTGWAPNSHALLLLQLRFDDETPYLARIHRWEA